MTVTEDYTIEIPETVRKSLSLQPGDQITIAKQGAKESPQEILQEIRAARGMIRHVKTPFNRDHGERCLV